MSPESSVDSDRKRDAESFFRIYLHSYRESIEAKEMDASHLPSFYKGAPYNIEIFLLPNDGVCALFKKGKQSRSVVVEGNFDEIKTKLDSRSFDFMKTLAPYTKLMDDEANRMGTADANRALEDSRRLKLLADVEAHLDHVKNDVNNMLELNPWLNEHADVQTEKVEKARELIKELYGVMEMDEVERFAGYERELMELRAFDGVKIEQITGEMEVEVESAVGELEEQIAELEDKVDRVEGDFEVVKNDCVTGRDELAREMGELRQMVVEMTTKVESVKMTAGAGMDAEIDDEFKSLRSSITKTTTKLGKLEKDIRDVRKEATITEEVKETVFRDSKRVHNLNDRVGEIENDLKTLASEKTKDYGSDITAIKKRLDKLEKDLEKKLEKMVALEVEKQKPHVIETPPPPPVNEEKTGGGTTVKKTTKTKKTKRTKKKKA